MSPAPVASLLAGVPSDQPLASPSWSPPWPLGRSSVSRRHTLTPVPPVVVNTPARKQRSPPVRSYRGPPKCANAVIELCGFAASTHSASHALPAATRSVPTVCLHQRQPRRSRRQQQQATQRPAPRPPSRPARRPQRAWSRQPRPPPPLISPGLGATRTFSLATRRPYSRSNKRSPLT